MTGHATTTSVAKSIYTPAKGAKCVHCGKRAKIHCPICDRDFCAGACLEVH